MEINDKIKMMNDTPHWRKGDIGRVVNIYKPYYLICFDSNCHKIHSLSNEHTWWARPDEIGKYPTQKRLMEVE